ncbi:hypothetical protein [Rhodococcus sp. JS3073]|uniref:hypothetical protein n=1 Tax=Rhodococcus sp. JS3073 TaxID=3002901 RepID=UPI00228590E1|nr:hypothetical protein [Rhodococcus sp. JS3073]WAM13937.1 hypothetical protein OYT95_31625 [Rhodococcus sp. JS3073]
MPSSPKISIPVSGNFPDLIVRTSTREGVDGVLIRQGDQWVWVDVESYDRLVSMTDALIEDDQEELGRLGKLYRHQLPPATTPAKRCH